MTDTKLLPLRVIVDRTVLVELLREIEHTYDSEGHAKEADLLHDLRKEVEQGKRTELYAKDWLGGDAS